MKKKDIRNRTDIETLVNDFYRQVKEDEVIGPIFTEVVPLVWELHLPVIYEFWETVLLHTGNYRGDPIRKHLEVDKKIPLTDAHFARWKALFFETVDRHFAGPVADDAKARVGLVEHVLKTKIEAARKSAHES